MPDSSCYTTFGETVGMKTLQRHPCQSRLRFAFLSQANRAASDCAPQHPNSDNGRCRTPPSECEQKSQRIQYCQNNSTQHCICDPRCPYRFARQNCGKLFTHCPDSFIYAMQATLLYCRHLASGPDPALLQLTLAATHRSVRHRTHMARPGRNANRKELSAVTVQTRACRCHQGLSLF